MDRHICIHGHFYQMPRENPWLEEVELQDSAYPYHDWNTRITAECYGPNTASRILGPDRKIIDIVNNYSKMSFDFGPTLLTWLERNEPGIYRAILEADTISRSTFSGHGTAMAHCYNHMIMPLANGRDKRTQIIWGIRDFESRFDRKPEGMWLPETAVDLESLDIMAEQGIAFSILAPRQARQVRRIGEGQWNDVNGARIDPKMPYVCRLPSGREIALFFYDGPISRDIAFRDILKNGEHFARRLLSGFSDQPSSQLVHVATDGETYGHHHHLGDMALAYCLYHLASKNLARITVFGEYLENHSPTHEVEIIENSSWSCVHGMERWRNDCGCTSGNQPGWNRQWRSALRGAMDWLRDNLIHVYEDQISRLVKDPWQARDDYIAVIRDRSPEGIQRFFKQHATRELLAEEQVTGLKLLEMQRNAMLMYTSCGWFFDDISGIESVQVMQFAARAMQLAQEVSGLSLEKTYITLLERAESNVPEHQNGGLIYEESVRPMVLDLVRVGVHHAVSSLFEEYSDTREVYTYTIQNESYEQEAAGKQKLAIGKAAVRSIVTLEESLISFAVVHLGDHNLVGGVRTFMGEESFGSMHREIREAFAKGDIAETIRSIERYFDTSSCSLWHLFKDEQRRVLRRILRDTLQEVEGSLRQINERHYSIMQVMRNLHIPLPKVLALTEEFIISSDLLDALQEEDLDLQQIQKMVVRIRVEGFSVDKATLDFLVSNRVNAMMEAFEHSPQDPSHLESVESLLGVLRPLFLHLNLWKAQNIYFSAGKRLLAEMEEKAAGDMEDANAWVGHFKKLGDHLGVRIV
ncbi:MAG: DUF3536 domain-containing protein [bacterium]